MNRVLIAQVAHDINQALRAAIGEAVEPWADTTPEHKASILAGVDMHIANPGVAPEASHEAWLTQKLAEGWTLGHVKDVEAKTHPCIRAYDSLPTEQKVKDYLFRAVVHSLKGIPDANAPAPERLLLPVKYIGPRENYIDGAFGSGIAFIKGETRMVPADLARQMYVHKTVYVPGEVVSDMATAKVGATEEDDAQDLRDSISNMDKASIAQFVKTHFQQEVDKRQSLTALRSHATGLVDQFGVV
jgi:hypothetical protein